MTVLHKRLIFLAALAVFIIMAFAIWGYSIDDAFITFRYAENLANGHGLVFNPGDKPVEGYSNFLWLLLLSLLYKMGLPTPETAKILSLALMAAAGAVWYFSFEKSDEDRLWLVGPLFLLCPITPFWGLSSLELGLHAALMAGAALAYLRKSRALYFLLPLLILNRPEGFIIAFLLLITGAVIDYLSHRPETRYLVTSAAIAIVMTIAMIVFRMVVFGHPLPNTFYAKMHHDPIIGFLEFGRMMLLFVPLGLGLVWGIIRVVRRPVQNPRLTVFVVLFAAQAIISSRVDPVMNFLLRYLVPFLPFLIAVCLIVVARLRSRGLQTTIVGLLAVASFIPVPKMNYFVKTTREMMAAQSQVIALAKGFAENATIAMSDMGRVPYYSGRRFNDLYGLVSEANGQEGFDSEREFSLSPDYFIFVGHVKGPNIVLTFWREQGIVMNPQFTAKYKFRGICLPKGADPEAPGYYYLIFGRRPEASGVQKPPPLK